MVNDNNEASAARNNTEPVTMSDREATVSDGDKHFTAKKYKFGAITWLVCTLLLIPSYLDTHIIAIAVLIPFTLFMTISFWREGNRLGVTLKSETLSIVNRKGLSFQETSVNYPDIRKINVVVSTENNEETINYLELITDSGGFLLPDVDDKDGLLKELKKRLPAIAVDKIDKVSDTQEKQSKGLLLFAVIVALAGAAVSLKFDTMPGDAGLLLRGLKGGFVGFILGTIVWIIGFNLWTRVKKH